MINRIKEQIKGLPEINFNIYMKRKSTSKNIGNNGRPKTLIVYKLKATNSDTKKAQPK